MGTARGVAIVAFLVASRVAVLAVAAQQPGLTHVDLRRHDLSVAGREVIQARVPLGEEITKVLEGSLEYQSGDTTPGT